MRDLTQEEIKEGDVCQKPDAALDGAADMYFPDETENGCKAVEAIVAELARLRASTSCGSANNDTFSALEDAGFGDQRVRCWYSNETNEVWGMCHIECDEEAVHEVEEMAEEAGGSLRLECASNWPGFWVFEIE